MEHKGNPHHSTEGRFAEQKKEKGKFIINVIIPCGFVLATAVGIFIHALWYHLVVAACAGAYSTSRFVAKERVWGVIWMAVAVLQALGGV